MKAIYLFLSLFCASAFAGSGSGNVSNVVNYGGPAMTSNIANGLAPYINIPPSLLSSLTTIVGGNSAPTANDFYGFYSASSPSSGSQTFYSVPGGKTFFVLGMYYGSGLANEPIEIGYGTAALGSEGTATPPTGAVFYAPSSTVGTSPFQSTVAVPSYTYFPVAMSFPAGSFPFWKSFAAQQTQLIMIGIVQ